MNVCVACGRYFVCLGSARGPAPPVFFYFGNEDNVELYVEHTGLMWESAPDMGAALVFLEHRYYGKSLPFPPNTPGGNSPMSASSLSLCELTYTLNPKFHKVSGSYDPALIFENFC